MEKFELTNNVDLKKGYYNFDNSRIEELGFTPLVGACYIPYEKLGELGHSKYNREINSMQINANKKSFETYGKYNTPIIINDDLVIIDGQHRVAIAEEKGEGVYAVIVCGLGNDAILALNQTNPSWKEIDFIKRYALEGIEDYRYLYDLTIRHPEISLGNKATLCRNEINPALKKVSGAIIKQKKFCVQREKEEIEFVANQLKEIYEILHDSKIIKSSLPNKITEVSMWILTDKNIRNKIEEEEFVQSFSKMARALSKKEYKQIPNNNDEAIELISDMYNDFCQEKNACNFYQEYQKLLEGKKNRTK